MSIRRQTARRLTGARLRAAGLAVVVTLASSGSARQQPPRDASGPVVSAGPARVVNGVSRRPFPLGRDDVRVGLLDVAMEAWIESAGRDVGQIVYALDGFAAWDLASDKFDARAGTVARVAPSVAYRIVNAGEDPFRAVYFEWAPGGDRSALEGESTLLESVPSFPGPPMGGHDLRRYESSPAVSRARSRVNHAHVDDVGWTTNWSYDAQLWKVYRYKPLVRPALADWTGIVQDDVRLGLQELDPGGVYPAHRHVSPEIYVVIEGEGRWIVDGRASVAGPGMAVETPANASHRIENAGAVPLRWLYFWWAPGGVTTSR